MEKKNIILICVSVLVVVGLFFASSMVNKEKNNEDKYKGKVAQIIVKDYGSILIELDYKNAPITVDNFAKLIEDKFYDGLTFHRIIDGFMIQGGGYTQDGNKKEASTIKGEFSLNNVDNKLSHTRGVISMARNEYDYNSASSEFFITLVDDDTFLDGSYAAFGTVVGGMDVVDKIAKDSNPTDDNGSIELSDRPVIESIRLVDRIVRDIDL